MGAACGGGDVLGMHLLHGHPRAQTGTEALCPDRTIRRGVTEFESLQGRASLNANLWDGQSAGKPPIKLRTVSSGACRPSRIISVMSGARKALRSVRLT